MAKKKVCDCAKKHIDTPETKTRLGGSSRLKKLNNNPD
jgi:hypothetical protein